MHGFVRGLNVTGYALQRFFGTGVHAVIGHPQSGRRQFRFQSGESCGIDIDQRQMASACGKLLG
jgi:hypothetical protein